MHVDPTCWRTRVGESLLSATLHRLRQDRWAEATLWVFDDNSRARSFYDKLGFKPDGATKRDERGPIKLEEGPLQRRLRRSLRSLNAATELQTGQ